MRNSGGLFGYRSSSRRVSSRRASKTEAGEGRTIPLNSSLLPVFTGIMQFGTERSLARLAWTGTSFRLGRPALVIRRGQLPPFKTAWKNVRKNAKVPGRWHDNRHTLITDLAERGAGDQTIMDIAGHVSKRMLRHYSHIRMKAKRTALESIV